MGDGGHLGGVHVEALAQAGAGGLRHHHDVIGQGGHFVEHGALMRRRVGQDGVGDDDGGDLESTQDLEHLVSVGAPVEAVLVLHDSDIGLVQCVRAGGHRVGRSVDQLADDAFVPRNLSAGVDDPYHAHLGVVARESRRKRSTERGQTTRSWRVGTENAERAGAMVRTLDG